MYTNNANLVDYLCIGSLDQLREQLDTARSEEHKAQKLLAAGERVLTKVVQEKKKLQDSNTKLGKELKDVRAQLADSVKENKKLRGGIFSILLNLPPCNFSEKMS